MKKLYYTGSHIKTWDSVMKVVHTMIFCSAGTGSQLRNKKRFPTMTCFVPADFTRYPPAFKALLEWYKWRRISIICDGGTAIKDSYTLAILQGQCKDFAGALKPSPRQSSTTQNYIVQSIMKDLSTASSRRAALLEAKRHSRSRFYMENS